jgi:hypothetical protein
MILIVLDIGKPSVTKDGHEIRTIRVADKTGCINLSIWDKPGTLLESGDIVRVNKVYGFFIQFLNVYINSLFLLINRHIPPYLKIV